MFYGFTESESFSDPTILNRYTHHRVVVEKRADGKGFWHIFILQIQDEDMERVTSEIARSIKGDWNAIFYDEDIVYAIFKDKIFTLKRKTVWNLSDYLQVKKYAKDCGVGDINMNKVFDHYRILLGEK